MPACQSAKDFVPLDSEIFISKDKAQDLYEDFENARNQILVISSYLVNLSVNYCSFTLYSDQASIRINFTNFFYIEHLLS